MCFVVTIIQDEHVEDMIVQMAMAKRLALQFVKNVAIFLILIIHMLKLTVTMGTINELIYRKPD